MENTENCLKIVLNGKTYKSKGFPNVGNFYDVETMKSILSNGMYHNMAISSTKNAQEASTMIAIEAYFSIFFPEFIKDMKVPLREMGLKDYVEIRKVYKDQFMPQFNEWTKVFNDLNDETE